VKIDGFFGVLGAGWLKAATFAKKNTKQRREKFLVKFDESNHEL